MPTYMTRTSKPQIQHTTIEAQTTTHNEYTT